MASPDEGSPVSAHFEIDLAVREEAYGPIRFRRYVKGDGRALILYTHGEPTGGGPVSEGRAHE